MRDDSGSGEDLWRKDVYDLMPQLSGALQRGRRHMPAALRDLADGGAINVRHMAVVNLLVGKRSRSVTELKTSLKLGLSTVSQLVADLARAGVVERFEDPLDRRRTLVRLLPQNSAAIEDYVHVRARPLMRATEGLTPVERDAFLKGMRRFIYALGRE